LRPSVLQGERLALRSMQRAKPNTWLHELNQAIHRRSRQLPMRALLQHHQLAEQALGELQRTRTQGRHRPFGRPMHSATAEIVC
jgi:hypothetical protein